MRVLHVIPSVSVLHGGPSVAVRRMAEVLASLGASVDVATTTADGRGELPVALDEPVCQNGVRYFYFVRQHPKSWTFSWPLTRWLGRHVGGYDVLHVHGLFSYPTLPACWAARRRSVPYLLRPLGTLDPWGLRQGRWKKALYLRLLERRNLVRAAAVQAVSERERRAIQHLGLPVEVVTVPLGVDRVAGVASRSERMGPTASADGIVTVLFLSRLHAKKGIELLLDAVELLPDEPVLRLVIAGDGEPGYVRHLHERAAEGKATTRVTFTGFATEREKRHLFNQADLFVLPSYDENFGLAVAEALSVGLPVVVSEHVALADRVRDAGAGLVVACDARELARAIATLVDDPDLRHRMGQTGRRLAEAEFSWPEVGRRLATLYEHVISHATTGNSVTGWLNTERHVEVTAPDHPRLSTIILAYNEEANLPACLASLDGLKCEVFVVDSGSTDRTREIAKAAGAQVVEHPFAHYGAQRNWAQENLPLRSDWLLHLDADERLTPDLVKEINHVVAAPPLDVDGFLLRKRTLFMGRWIRHGGHYPSYHLRLLRRDRGFCEDRLYDQHFIVKGCVAKLRHDYLDVVASDLTTWASRHIRWAELEATEMLSGNHGANRVEPRVFGTAIERRRWLRERVFWRSPLFSRALSYWIYRYVFRLGFLDGVEGLIFHFLQGCWYRFLVDAQIYEARRNSRPRTVASLERDG